MTFSTCVACGWLIHSFSEYFRVKISPVFWIFGSNNFKLADKSSTEVSIAGSNAKSAFIEKKSTALIKFFLSTSTSQRLSPVLIKSLFAKLSTINPVLNRLNPFASVTCRDFVSNSSILNVVVNSRFLTLLSIFPISRIVYLLLSRNIILGSLTGSKR